MSLHTGESEGQDTLMGTMAAKMCKQEYQQVFINSTRGPSLKVQLGMNKTKTFLMRVEDSGKILSPIKND